jgi:hypothetical protein
MFQFKAIAGLLLAMTLGSGATAVLPAGPSLAQSASGSSAQSSPPRPNSDRFGGFFAPQGKAMPRDSEGGASRGQCQPNNNGPQQAVRLLIPQGNNGLTTASHPTFLAHINQAASQQVFFSLKNADESYFYEMSLPLPASHSGRVAFQLPETAPPLSLEESYRWSVALLCGSQLGPDSPWASGWIERVAPDPAQAETLATLSPLEQASYLGRQGLWYDTVETLANLQENQPGAAVEAAWTQLMQEAGLDLTAEQ